MIDNELTRDIFNTILRMHRFHFLGTFFDDRMQLRGYHVGKRHFVDKGFGVLSAPIFSLGDRPIICRPTSLQHETPESLIADTRLVRPDGLHIVVTCRAKNTNHFKISFIGGISMAK